MKKPDQQHGHIKMKYSLSLFVVFISVGLFNYASAGWQVSQEGGGNQVYYINNTSIIPLVPVGSACNGTVLIKLNPSQAIVQTDVGMDFYALCEFIETVPVEPPVPEPPVITRTFSQTYGLPAPADVTGIVSYVQYTTDGTSWSAWTATQSGLTGCIRYSVPDAIGYQAQTAYVNSIGEGPKSAIVQIAVTAGQPVC